MKFIERLRNKISIKNVLILLCFSLFLNGVFLLFDVFNEYVYIIEILCWRLFFLLCILVLAQSFFNLPFIKDLQEEMSIFNEGPTNKSFFTAYLREYHFSLLLSTYLFYILAVTYFVEDPQISYLLGLIAFISFILYGIQFVVYTNSYIKKSFNSNKSIFKDRKGQIRGMFTAANAKKVATVCLECSKGIVSIGVGLEVGCKLAKGSMNAVSPLREVVLNHTFPEDRTKTWSETKAATAIHNRSMGRPHDAIYDSVRDQIAKVALPQKKP